MDAYDYTTLAEKYVVGSGEEIDDLNPATGKPLARIKTMTAEEARAAIERGVEAFQAWGWLTPVERGRILYRAGEIMEEEKHALARLITEEEGKTLRESLAEVTRSYELLKFYGMLAFKHGGITLPSADKNTRIFTVREPLGTVGLITPWNFPLSIPVWKSAPALAAGNTVVLKPATKTPLIAAAYAHILGRAGLPEGVLSLVVGRGSSVGDVIVKSGDIAAVSFTGSLAVGRSVYRALASKERFTRWQLELGGKNALYVDESADLGLAVNLAVRGAFGLTGQSCTATSRLIVHRNVYERVRAGLLEALKRWRVGCGLEEGVDMGPVVDEAQLKTDLHYIELGREEGANLLVGGQTMPELGSSLFLAPTVFESVTPEMRIFQEEIFGPILAVSLAENLEHAIELVNAVQYGHTAGIVARDVSAINRFVSEVEAGVVKVNKPTVGLELQAPFGTLKSSGSNTWKEMGEEALEFYTTEKTVYEGW